MITDYQDPKPFEHVDLQWFAEDGDPAPDPGKNAEPEPTPEPEPEPKSEPPGEPPIPKYLSYAPDKYKKDPKFLEDLSKHKSWGEILDRMYEAEGKLSERPEAPETPEGYEFAETEFPEHLQGDENKEYREAITAYLGDVAKAIRELAHKNGLSKEAAQEINTLFVKQVFDQEKAARDVFEKDKQSGLEKLKVDWKGDFEANTEISRRGIQAFGGDALVALFDELGVSNHHAIVKTFYEIGKAMGEDTLVPGSTPAKGVSEEEAAARKRYNKSPELFELSEQKKAQGGPPEPSEDLKKRYKTMV